MDRTAKTRQDRPKGLLASVLLLLVIQFALGIYTNLFVTLSKMGPFMGLGGFMGIGGSMGVGEMLIRGRFVPLFMVHMMLGILVALMALIIALVSLVRGGSRFVILAWTSLLAVLAAGYSGLRFVMYGQHNGDSFVMAIGWMIAFSAYFMAVKGQ